MDPFSDPRAFVAKVERYLARVSELGRGGDCVTYAIKDPRGGDTRDPTDGSPFYVGQTSDLGRRARQHLRKGGAARNGGVGAAVRIYAILLAGKLPIFEPLEWVQTRAASLESETRWAQKFRDAGHDLANQWAEHRTGGSMPRSVPTKRLWAFTLEQAENDNIEIGIHCRKCGLDAPLPISDLIARSRSTVSLASIRRMLSCPGCGHNPCIKLRRTPSLQDAGRNPPPQVEAG